MSELKRLFAWLTNLCLGRLILSLLWPIESFQRSFQHSQQGVGEVLTSLVGLESSAVIFADILLFLFFAHLLASVFALFTGLSPGQWLWGIRYVEEKTHPKGQWRVRVAARELLIFPLLLAFPLQCLSFLGFYSPQDSLTQTTGSFFVPRDIEKPLDSLRGLVLFIIGLIALIVSPFGLEDYAKRDEALFVKGAPKEKGLGPLTEKKEKMFSIYHSRRFQFSTQTPISLLSDESYLFMPSFEFEKKPKKMLLSPQLRIFHLSSECRGRLNREGRLNWKNVMRFAKQRLPLFAFHYPSLNSFLNDKGQMDNSQVNQLKELLSDVFRIEMSSEWTFSGTGKFWRAPYYQLRERFESFVAPAGKTSVSFLTMGSDTFLRFRQYFTNQIEGKTKPFDRLSETFISLNRAKTPVYKFEWRATDQNSSYSQILKTSEDFLAKFFANAKWGESPDKSVSEQTIHSLAVLDLTNSERSDERQLLGYYSSLVERVKAFAKEKPMIRETLLRELLQLQILVRAKKQNDLFNVGENFAARLGEFREKLKGDR